MHCIKHKLVHTCTNTKITCFDRTIWLGTYLLYIQKKLAFIKLGTEQQFEDKNKPIQDYDTMCMIEKGKTSWQCMITQICAKMYKK